jgi:hypothetical protein
MTAPRNPLTSGLAQSSGFELLAALDVVAAAGMTCPRAGGSSACTLRDLTYTESSAHGERARTIERQLLRHRSGSGNP